MGLFGGTVAGGCLGDDRQVWRILGRRRMKEARGSGVRRTGAEGVTLEVNVDEGTSRMAGDCDTVDFVQDGSRCACVLVE